MTIIHGAHSQDRGPYHAEQAKRFLAEYYAGVPQRPLNLEKIQKAFEVSLTTLSAMSSSEVDTLIDHLFLIANLDLRQRRVIIPSYGLEDGRRKNYAEISALQGISMDILRARREYAVEKLHRRN